MHGVQDGAKVTTTRKDNQMSTEYRWVYVKSIEATDEMGNSYQIDQEQWVGTVHPLNGHTHSVGGKTRFMCDGEPVIQLPNGDYRLVQRGITVNRRGAIEGDCPARSRQGSDE